MSYKHKGFDNDGFEMDVPDTGYGTIGKPPNNDIYFWNDASLGLFCFIPLKSYHTFENSIIIRMRIKTLICHFKMHVMRYKYLIYE